MKKKITLFLAFLNVTTPLALYPASPPLSAEFTDIYHCVSPEGSLMISPDRHTNFCTVVDATLPPAGRTRPLKELIEITHKELRHPFSFMLCKTPQGLSVAVLTDYNLIPLQEIPQGLIPQRSYRLYPGETGKSFPPGVIMAPAHPPLVQPMMYLPPAMHTAPVSDETVSSALSSSLVTDTTTSLSLTPPVSTSSPDTSPTKEIVLPVLPAPEPTGMQENLTSASTPSFETPNKEKPKSKRGGKELGKTTAALVLEKETLKNLQRERDRAASALQRETQEAAKKAEKEAAKKAEKEKKKSAAGAAACAPTRKTPSSGPDHDDALLEKEMKRVTALKAALPQQQAGAAAVLRKGFTESASASDTPSSPALSDGKGLNTSGGSLSPEEDLVATISYHMLKSNFMGAKQLLKGVPPKTLQKTIFLNDLYLNAQHLLTKREIEEFIESAHTFAHDKATEPWYRCTFYFALSLHATNEEEKEKFLEKCINHDLTLQHPRAHALHKIFLLKRCDARAELCKTKTGSCLHTQVLDAIKTSDRTDEHFEETIYLKIYLLLKSLSGSCRQLETVMEKEKRNPRKELIDFYNAKVRRGWIPTRTALSRINSLLPADIIPPAQLHQRAESD
jgi:hypothetical protein